MGNEVDAEINAIERIVTTLKVFDERQRRRILWYAAEWANDPKNAQPPEGNDNDR